MIPAPDVASHTYYLGGPFPGEFEVLDVSYRKNSVRDKVIGKEQIYLERNTPPQTEFEPTEKVGGPEIWCG